MPAKILSNYYLDYDKDMALTCPVCGWSGPANEAPMETPATSLIGRVPNDAMLIIVPWPTKANILAGAIAGNEEAIRAYRRWVQDEREAAKPAPPRD